jgi:hypothetical protein
MLSAHCCEDLLNENVLNFDYVAGNRYMQGINGRIIAKINAPFSISSFQFPCKSSSAFAHSCS